MPVKILIMACLIALGIGFALWDTYRAPGQPVSTKTHTAPETKTSTVPNAHFSDLNGTRYALHDFKGRVILLNFWATWCPPCIKEFPQLLQLAARNKETLTFIALSVDEDTKNIERFMKRLKPEIRAQMDADNVIIGHDPGKTISQDMFQTVMYPESFIIAPDLTLKRKIVGATDWLSEDIKHSITPQKSTASDILSR